MNDFKSLAANKENNRQLVRSTFSVAAPTLLSRVLGYLRDMIQAFYLGTGMGADAFTIAYIIPNLLRRLSAEGAMTAAFVPVFTEIRKQKPEKEVWRFANSFFFDLTLVMLLVTILGIVFSPFLVKIIAFGFKDVEGKWELTTLLTRIMFPYIFLISLASLAMAILNSFHKFFVPAFTPVLLNLVIIGLALVFARRVEKPAVIFAIGVVMGGILQVAFQIPFLWNKGMRFKPSLSFSHPAVRKVGELMVPGVFGVGISQINFALSRMIASQLEEGSVSSLYYASRVEELTLGLFSIALSIALLPMFSDFAAEKDVQGIKRTLIFSFKLISLITFPAMVGLMVLNRQIIQVLFERGIFNAQSTTTTASCLLYFAVGLPFISATKVLAPAFYSLKDTKTPVIVAFFVMLSYISFSLILMKPLKVGGIAFALSLSSALNLLLLFILLEKKIGKIEKKPIFSSACRALSSAGVMGLAVWFFMKEFNFAQLDLLYQLGLLLSAILMGIMIYFLLQVLFNREDTKILKNAFSGK